MNDEMNNEGMGAQDAPLLIFGDASGNPISEISLAPGEQKKIKVILSKQPEAVVQNFQAQWNVYDSNHQQTDKVTCVVDPDTKKWLTPLCLSTDDDSVGGMNGNSLISAKVDNGVWRCMGKNPNGQFWYPRDLFTPPVPVAEFTLVASDDWTGNCVTLELDSNYTKFTQTADTAVPAASNYTAPCNYSMMLAVNNANSTSVAPSQGNEGTTTTPTPPQDSEENNTDSPTENQNNYEIVSGPLVPEVKLEVKLKDPLIEHSCLTLNFLFNTFRIQKDASGNNLKVPARIGAEYTMKILVGKDNASGNLPLEQDEYLDGNVKLKTEVVLDMDFIEATRTDLIKESRNENDLRNTLSFLNVLIALGGVHMDDAYLDASSGRIELLLFFNDDCSFDVAKESPSQVIGTYFLRNVKEEMSKLDAADIEEVNRIIKLKQADWEKAEQEKAEREKKKADAARREAIRDGLRNTDVNPKTVLLNDTLFNEPKGTGATIYMKNGICYQLTNVNHPFSRKDIRVKGAGIGNIYPGAIVIADSHLTEGNPVPLNNVPRAKIEVYPDFYVENNKPEVIDVSSSGAVHNAIGQLLNKLFGSSKYKPAKNTKFNDTTYTSKYEMMIGMGVDSSFCGCDLKVNIGINNNEFSFVQDTSLNQDFFTIRLSDGYRSDLTKLFGSDVTWETIKKNSTINGKVQPLAIITSVTYGRSLHYLKEYSSKSFKFDGSQSFSGFGTDVSFTEMVKQSSKASKVQIISLGDGDAGGRLIQASGGLDLEEGTNSEAQAIRKVLAETAEFGPGNQGIPVSYTIELLSGPAAVAIDPQYDGNYVETTELQACPSNYIDIQVKSGVNPIGFGAPFQNEQETLKLVFKYKTFRLSQDKDGNYIKQPGYSASYRVEKKYVHNWSRFVGSTLQMQAGDYLDGYVRMDMYAGRPNDMTKYISDGLIDASSGVIKLIIDGGVFEKPQAYIHEDSPTKLLGHVGEK